MNHLSGQGRRSSTLGASDPRHGRGAGAFGATLTTDPVYIDNEGRIALRPAKPVADTAALFNDTTGGTPDGSGTLVDVGALYDQGTLNDNFATVAAQVESLRAEVNDLKAALRDALLMRK